MKKDIYIVYHTTTKNIIKSFEWFGDADRFSKINDNFKCINRTHPTNKEILKELTPHSFIEKLQAED